MGETRVKVSETPGCPVARAWIGWPMEGGSVTGETESVLTQGLISGG